MYRAWARTAQQGAVASTRRAARPRFACRCYSADPSAPALGTEPTPTYSLPHDAFDANPADSAASSSASAAAAVSAEPHSHFHSDPPARRVDGGFPGGGAGASVPRRRQRQTLSNAEAQAFADLLGEIMPRTAAQPTHSSSSNAEADAANSGLFGIFASEPGSTTPSTARGTNEGGRGGDISKVQQALMRKVGYKMGMQLDPSGTGRWTRKARTELTEQEELELDRLREQLLGLKSDYEVLQWGLEKVFGFDKARVNVTMVSPDPNALPVLAAPSEQQPQLDSTTASPSYGPQSRLYPDLLLLLFLVLRDTHRNPTCALSLFRLAKSNPFSYVNGCTTAVYLEVLRTHWAGGAGDIEAVWQGLDEMRANGVAFDDKVRELVRSIGEAIRIDQERAELRYDHDRERERRGADVVEAEEDATERERQILRRRWFDASQIGAWSRMERIVEENQDELEEMRQKREDERWHDSERARRDRFHLERERAHRDRPDLIDRAGAHGSASSLWGPASGLSSPAVRRRSGITTGADGLNTRDDPLGATRPAWETWQVPIAERDEDGNPIMPKRPSFVNPFKIRRKGLTKEEKARKDTRHPALWWKK